jgi:hypothetical protein
MKCTNEMQYNELSDEACDLWYTLSKNEKDILNELVKVFKWTQEAKPWIQDSVLRNKLDHLVPKLTRDHIFFQPERKN